MAVTVDVEGGDLVVRVSGWDAVWAMSSGLRVPLHQVLDASVMPRGSLGSRRETGRRGSRVTGVLKSGWYAGRGWSELWVTRWPDRLLVVSCAPEARYDRLVLDVPDPDAAAARVRAAAAKTPGSDG